MKLLRRENLFCSIIVTKNRLIVFRIRPVAGYTRLLFTGHDIDCIYAAKCSSFAFDVSVKHKKFFKSFSQILSVGNQGIILRYSLNFRISLFEGLICAKCNRLNVCVCVCRIGISVLDFPCHRLSSE
jgi:hypothetical protein